MTDLQMMKWMRKLIFAIKVLAVICIIELIVLGVVTIINNRKVNAAEYTQETYVEDQQQNYQEEQKEPANVSSTSGIIEKTLEDKYSSVFEWQVYGGDFGIEQLYFLNEQCEKYEIPMEVMLSLICTESGFHSTAKAKTSSASGYCQIIKSTAQWVYENLLKYGTYDIDNHTEIMTTNWKLNIEISCRLMYCLYWNNNQSWDNAIRRYYGSTVESDNDTYLGIVNSHMIDLFGITTADLK